MYSSTHFVTVNYKDINGVARCTTFQEVDIYTLSAFITGLSWQCASEIIINVADPEPTDIDKENIKCLF